MAEDRTTHASPAAGYRNPPAATRFRKGQSGNPAGKLKGTKNKPRSPGDRLRSLMLEEAYRPVKVNENGKEITMPVARAVCRSLAAAAARGEARAQAMFLKLLSASEIDEATIDAMLADMHEPQKPTIEMHIIDADGRPTGDVVYPYGGGPGRAEKPTP